MASVTRYAPLQASPKHVHKSYKDVLQQGALQNLDDLRKLVSTLGAAAVVGSAALNVPIRVSVEGAVTAGGNGALRINIPDLPPGYTDMIAELLQETSGNALQCIANTATWVNCSLTTITATKGSNAEITNTLAQLLGTPSIFTHTNTLAAGCVGLWAILALPKGIRGHAHNPQRTRLDLIIDPTLWLMQTAPVPFMLAAATRMSMGLIDTTVPEQSFTLHSPISVPFASGEMSGDAALTELVAMLFLAIQSMSSTGHDADVNILWIGGLVYLLGCYLRAWRDAVKTPRITEDDDIAESYTL